MPAGADALTGDVVVGFNFKVEMSGKIQGFFTEVSGLNTELEVVELKLINPETGEDLVRKMPGRATAGEVTLKRPVTTNRDVWDWRKLVEQGNIHEARTNGTITAMSQDGVPVAAWEVRAAWPSKVTATTLDAGSGEVVMEEMTIQYESAARVPV